MVLTYCVVRKFRSVRAHEQKADASPHDLSKPHTYGVVIHIPCVLTELHESSVTTFVKRRIFERAHRGWCLPWPPRAMLALLAP